MIPYSPMPVAAPPAQTTGQPAAADASIENGNSFADELATGDRPTDSGQKADAGESSISNVTPNAEPLPDTAAEPPEGAIVFSDVPVRIAEVAETKTAGPAVALQPTPSALPAQGDASKLAELHANSMGIRTAQKPTPTDSVIPTKIPSPEPSLSSRVAPDVTQSRTPLSTSTTQPAIPSPEILALNNGPAQTFAAPQPAGKIVADIPAPTPPVQRSTIPPPHPSHAIAAQSPAITATIPPVAQVVQAAPPPPNSQPIRTAIETANRTYSIATASTAKPVASTSVATPDVTPLLITDTIEPLSRVETASAIVERTNTAHNAATTTATPDQARVVTQQLITVLPTNAPGTTEITLQPEELGRVRMTLTLQDGAMTLLIQADRPDTADLLRRNIDQLAQAYRQLGFDTLNFSFAGSAGQDANAAEAVAPEQTMTAEETSEQATDIHRSPPQSLATTRLDLRI